MRVACTLVLRLMWARLISALIGKSSGSGTGIENRVVLFLVGVGVVGVGGIGGIGMATF